MQRRKINDRLVEFVYMLKKSPQKVGTRMYFSYSIL